MIRGEERVAIGCAKKSSNQQSSNQQSSNEQRCCEIPPEIGQNSITIVQKDDLTWMVKFFTREITDLTELINVIHTRWNKFTSDEKQLIAGTPLKKSGEHMKIRFVATYSFDPGVYYETDDFEDTAVTFGEVLSIMMDKKYTMAKVVNDVLFKGHGQSNATILRGEYIFFDEDSRAKMYDRSLKPGFARFN